MFLYKPHVLRLVQINIHESFSKRAKTVKKYIDIKNENDKTNKNKSSKGGVPSDSNTAASEEL